MKFSIVFLIAALMPLTGFAQYASNAPFIYPKQGQSGQQQSQDAGTCRSWAMQQTGVDPAYLQGQIAMVQSQGGYSSGEMPVARGIARGVAAGAIMGEIHDEMDPGAGRGAAMGLTAGAMQGIRQRREMARQQEAIQAQQQMMNLQNRLQTYNRAFSACMDAKGYSVN